MRRSLVVLNFQLMAAVFWLRDRLRPRCKVLAEVGIRPRSRVLDYGCGTGSYIRDSARLVGDEGVVYALDVNPLAIYAADRIAAREGLRNVRTILSNCATGLPDMSVDVVLVYDVLHDLSNRDDVLREIERILKPDGILSVSDHHMRGPDVVTQITSGRRFRLASSGRLTYSFAKGQGTSRD